MPCGRFSEAFIERARAGLEVNLVLDGYGSAKLDEGPPRPLRQRWIGNFDSRSFDLDLEVNVAVLVEQLSGHFLEDLGVSTEIDLETWRKRPAHKRVAEYATEVIRQSL